MKFQSFIKPVYIFIFCILGLISCKKYDEGPGLSFRSKKERIANTWAIEKAIENGADSSKKYSTSIVVFTKEGTYFLTDEKSSLALFGTWELTSDDKKIEAYFKNIWGTTEVTHYKILKLKENEVWVMNEEKNTEFHFVPKDI